MLRRHCTAGAKPVVLHISHLPSLLFRPAHQVAKQPAIFCLLVAVPPSHEAELRHLLGIGKDGLGLAPMAELID